MVVPADRLGEQLNEKVTQLRALTDQIRNDLLDPVAAHAQDADEWSGGPQRAFCGWLDVLHGWVSHQLAGALEEVANRMADQLSDRTSAQAALATGIPGATLPPPPRPIGTTLPPPPPFHIATTRDRKPKMNPEGLRSGLVKALGQARDQVLDLSRRLDGLLTEPSPNPLPPGIAGPVIPAHELPPDAKQAAGVPAAFNALAGELDRALQDVVARAKKWDEAVVGTSSGAPGLAALAADVSALGVEVGSPRQVALVRGASPGIECATPVKTAADPDEQARAAAAEFGEIAKRPFFDGGDQGDLARVLHDADHYANDPAYAAAFIAAFVPESLRRWCKLANNSVIDLQTTAELLFPLGRLLGTATRAPGGLDPKVRKTLLDSRCLDTMVQFGAFDNGFAIEAAQKILKNPGYYERSDKTDRVYGSIDEKGNFISGDARYGALQLLANNPAAAQHFFEKADGVRRTDMLKYLEDGGLVGEAAARALEAGLHDLTHKESVDTLELALRLTAHGNLRPKGAGKEALARLLTRTELANAVFEPKAEADSANWSTDSEGWSVPSGTMAKAFSEIVKDAEARAVLLAGLAVQANSLLQQAAVVAGDQPDLEQAMSDYFVTIGKVGRVFRTVGTGVDEAAKKKEPNSAMVAGLELAISESAKLLPGGVVVVETAKAGAKLGVNWLIEQREEERLKELSAANLKAELRDKIRIFAILNLFSNEKLVAQLIPPGSPLDRQLRDEQGRIKIPEPPIGNVPIEPWWEFVGKLRAPNSPMRTAINEADLWAESYTQ